MGTRARKRDRLSVSLGFAGRQTNHRYSSGLEPGRRCAVSAEKNKLLERRAQHAGEYTTERVDALVELAWSVWTSDAPRAKELSRQALETAEALDYGAGAARAKRNLGLLAYAGAEIKDSLRLLHEALQWFEENGDKEGEADVRVGLAYICWGFGDFKKGLDAAFKSLQLYEDVGNPEGQGWALIALGGFYHDWNDHEQARDYFDKATGVFEKAGNAEGLGRALNGIGNALQLQGRHEEALEYQEKSLEAHGSVGNVFGAGKTLNDIGLIYQSLGKYDDALDYHKRSLESREKRAYHQGVSTCLLDIGNVYIATREYEKASETLNKALAVSERIEAKPKICRAHRLLSELYRETGQFEAALEHYKTYHRIEDEVYHEALESKLENLKAAHQIEASEKEAEIFRLKNIELKNKNDQLEETMELLRNTQAQLIQSGKMVALGKLAAGIVHELNSPAGTIKSAADVNSRAVEKVARYVEDAFGCDDKAAKTLAETLDLMRANANNAASGAERIGKIIQRLKNFVRLDEAKFQKTNVHDGIESTLALIGPEIGSGVTIEKDFGDLPEIYAYPGELNQVFMNLLLNASEAVGSDGVISIKTSAENGNVSIKIADNGKGIPRDRLEDLFEPGFTKTHKNVRMRTGLYTSHTIVLKHGGELKADSEPGRGTAFTITIPDRLDQILSPKPTA